jgi:Protein of unknown function (DUF4089)
MAKKRAKSSTKSKRKAKSKPKFDLSRVRKRRAIWERPTTVFPAWLVSEPGDDPLDVLIGASAHALALPVEPAWKPAIKTNLDVTLRLAASFADFPLPDDAEPAPVFVA